MKITTQFLISILFLTNLALASNGTHLASVSAEAAGVAGASQANAVSELEALYRNPALIGATITATGKPKIELSAVVGKHNAQAAVVSGSTTLPAYSASNDKLAVLPSIATSMKLSESLSAGVAYTVFGGSTVNYTGNTSLSEQKSEQMLTRLLPGISYAVAENFRLGAALVVGYSTIALNGAFGAAQTRQSPKSAWGIGGLLGANFNPSKNWKIGASFLTRTTFKYKSLFNLTLLSATPNPAIMNDITIQEPSEIAAGVAYVMDDWTFAFDYRRIGWSHSDGYTHLGWRDQNVFVVAAQYRTGALTWRAGINYGKSPVPNAENVNGDQTYDFQGVTVLGGAMAQTNIIGFASFSEWEVDAGVGYDLCEQMKLNLALGYTPSTTITQSGTMGGAPYAVSTKANEWGVVAGATYQF